MGYFSNGSEGEGYEHRYCRRCANNSDDGCSVWLAHLLYNGDAPQSQVLDLLIPRSKDGLDNLQCTMFREVKP